MHISTDRERDVLDQLSYKENLSEEPSQPDCKWVGNEKQTNKRKINKQKPVASLGKKDITEAHGQLLLLFFFISGIGSFFHARALYLFFLDSFTA